MRPSGLCSVSEFHSCSCSFGREWRVQGRDGARVFYLWGLTQQGRQGSPGPSQVPYELGGHRGPGHTGAVGGREENSSAQKAMQFSLCPEQRRKAGEAILLQPGHWIVGEPGYPGCSSPKPWSSCQGLGDRIDGLVSALVSLSPTGHWVTESGFSWSHRI